MATIKSVSGESSSRMSAARSWMYIICTTPFVDVIL